MIAWLLSKLFPPRLPAPLTEDELAVALRSREIREEEFFRGINAQQRRILLGKDAK